MSDMVAVSSGQSDRRLVIVYSVDERPPQVLAVALPPNGSSPQAEQLVLIAASMYLASLCLAKSVVIRDPVDLELLDAFRPLVKMLYDIRRWKDDLPSGPPPRLLGIPGPAALSDTRQTLDPARSIVPWSGGKDSTLALLTLRANGYDCTPIHFPVNSGSEMAELEAVQALAAEIETDFDLVEFSHEDFLPLSNAYADEWDRFPLCNRVPFGRDLVLIAVASAWALARGAGCVSLGHDHECRSAHVIHHGTPVPRNDMESAEASMLFEAIVRRHVHSELRLLPAVANVSELRILRDMFQLHPELMAKSAFCFWGARCGRCAKCLRYFLADRVYGAEILSFDVNPLSRGACPELDDYLADEPRSDLFQREVLVLLGRLVERGDIRAVETELSRFSQQRYPTIASALDDWEEELLAEHSDIQIPRGFRPLSEFVPWAHRG